MSGYEDMRGRSDKQAESSLWEGLQKSRWQNPAEMAVVVAEHARTEEQRDAALRMIRESLEREPRSSVAPYLRALYRQHLYTLDEKTPQAHTAALSAVLPNLQHERSSFRETALGELICYFKTNAGAAFEGCGPAVSRLLRKYGAGPKVLDLAIGGAAELSYMKDDGWDAFGNDIDAVQVERARMLFGADGDDRIFCGDWGDLCSAHGRECYDAAYLVGNSLCYLRTLDEHRSVLRQFFDVLKPGGLLVIDSRNYDKIFRLQDHILEDPVRNFQFSYMQAYTGDMQALVYPVAVDGQVVTLELAVPAKRLLGRLQVYGCRKREMEQLFEESEFSLEDTYFDCRWGLSEELGHYDYVTWVLRKPMEGDRREH